MDNQEKSVIIGKQSFRPARSVYIRASASVVGTKEGQGKFHELFDMIGEDDSFGCKTWEESESILQKEAVTLALGKAALTKADIRYLFAGDLLGQCTASSFGIENFSIPTFGVYGACSTCGESISLGTMAVSGGFAESVICVTSSHFAVQKKSSGFHLRMETSGL